MNHYNLGKSNASRASTQSDSPGAAPYRERSLLSTAGLLAYCSSQNEVLESVQSKVAFDVWDNETYKDNLIKLEVYFEEFNFEEISETPSYVVRITPRRFTALFRMIF